MTKRERAVVRCRRDGGQCGVGGYCAVCKLSRAPRKRSSGRKRSG